MKAFEYEFFRSHAGTEREILAVVVTLSTIVKRITQRSRLSRACPAFLAHNVLVQQVRVVSCLRSLLDDLP